MQDNKLSGSNQLPSSNPIVSKNHEPILVAIFTQKGGVGKTTSALNIASLLAREHTGKQRIKILLVDGDPQCNLTAICLKREFLQLRKKQSSKNPQNLTADQKEQEEDDEKILSDELEKFYQGDENFVAKLGEDNEIEKTELMKITVTNNLFRALVKIKDLEVTPVQAAEDTKLLELKEIAHDGNLYLLPSSIDLYHMDHALTILTESKQIVPGNTSMLFKPTEYIRELGRKHKFDLIFIDLSPNIGGLNQSLLLCSDYFMMPGDASFFTMQSVYSLARALPEWVDNYLKAWARKPGTTRETPLRLAKFLTLYVQKVKYSREAPTIAYQDWISKIERAIKESLLPVLRNPIVKQKKAYQKDYDMTIPDANYSNLAVINQMDRSLPDADKLGIPIVNMNSSDAIKLISIYNKKQKISKGEKISGPKKANIERYKREFRKVIQHSVRIIAQIDNRMRNNLKRQFAPSYKKLSSQLESILVEVKKTQFEALLRDELQIKRYLATKTSYPLTISNMFKLLYSLRKKWDKQKNKDMDWNSIGFSSKNDDISILTNPYLLPDEKNLDEFEQRLVSEIGKIKKIKPYIVTIPCYYQLTWVVFKVYLDKKNKDVRNCKVIFSRELDKNLLKTIDVSSTFDRILQALLKLKIIKQNYSKGINPIIISLKLHSKKPESKATEEEKEKHKHLVPWLFDDMQLSNKPSLTIIKRKRKRTDSSAKKKSNKTGRPPVVTLERILFKNFPDPHFSKEDSDYFQTLHQTFINDLTADFSNFSKQDKFQEILKLLSEQRLYQLGKKSTDLVKIIILISLLELLKKSSEPDFDGNAIIAFLHNLFEGLNLTEEEPLEDIEEESNNESDDIDILTDSPPSSPCDLLEEKTANNYRRHWYTWPEINILLTNLRREIIYNRESKPNEVDPFRETRESRLGVFLANAFHVVNPENEFRNKLEDYINSITGEHKDDQRLNKDKWTNSPAVLIFPILYSNHWHVIRVVLNHLNSTVSILWDDPFGRDHFPHRLKQGLLAVFKEQLPHLLNYQRGTRPAITVLDDKAVSQHVKTIDQQGAHQNGWDCGPIIVSNISDYLKNPLRRNQEFAQQQTRCYTVGASNEEGHDDKVISRRIVDYHARTHLSELEIPQDKCKEFENEQDKFTQSQLKEIKDTLGQSPDWIPRLTDLNSQEAVSIFYGILQSLRQGDKEKLLVDYTDEILRQAYEQTLKILADKNSLPAYQPESSEKALPESLMPSKNGTLTRGIFPAPGRMSTRSSTREENKKSLNL